MTRVSTIVSVIFEDFSSSNVDLKVSIKFYDFALPSNGSSGSLTCASAKIPENPSQDNILKDSLWNLTDSDCKLERNYSNFAGNGNTGIITCICNKPGTFAIIDHKTVDSNEVNMFVIFQNLLFTNSYGHPVFFTFCDLDSSNSLKTIGDGCISPERFNLCIILFFHPNWHELREQEKCSFLAPPRSTFHKTQ